MSPRPEHIPAVLAAEGLLFASGGLTSHVAVIARGSGKPCIMGVYSLRAEPRTSNLQIGGRTIAVRTWLSIDGSTGAVYEGHRNVAPPDKAELAGLDALLARCDAQSEVSVFANADTVEEARSAFDHGAGESACAD
jgi:pyruvate,orthophosphate dikinase